MSAKTIVLCGGGTGGHIVPTLHVAHALKQLAPGIRLIYLIEKESKFSRLVEQNEDIDKLYMISAGKLRRYQGRNTTETILDVKTNWQNLTDVFRTIRGVSDARRILKREKPGLLFAKGGYVGVPAGYAAYRLGIPIITHDSDEEPGLANKTIGRWATLRLVTSDHAAAAYDRERTKIVGIPIDPRFQPVDKAGERTAKQALGIDPDKRYVTIIGGSLGAQRINMVVRAIMTDVLLKYPNLVFVWVVGAENETTELSWLEEQPLELRNRVLIRSFIDNVASWFAASDVIISRAGATTTAEIIAAAKPSILIPAAFLPSGHQVQNAEALSQKGVVRIVYEVDDLEEYATMLEQELTTILDFEGIRNIMHDRAMELSKDRAADVIAKILLENAS